MFEFGSRRGASNLGIPLMIVTFVLIGGFMYWLSITAEPTELLIVEEEPEEIFLGTILDPGALELDQGGFEGQEVRLIDVPFSTAVGTQAFFISLPQGSPFLVRMSDEMVAAGEMVPTSQVMMTVTGTLNPLNDSIKADWFSDGTVAQGDQVLVDFATHYLEATDMISAGGSPPAAGNGGA